MTRTLDKIFLSNAEINPDQTAISRWSDESGTPLTVPSEISYREAANYITHLAGMFRTLGFREGDIVLTQLPNRSETPLILLALLNAGLVPSIMPAHWRFQEIGAAVASLKPGALLLSGNRMDTGAGERPATDSSAPLYELAMQHISLRFIFGLGDNLPDGLTPLPDLAQSRKLEKAAPKDAVELPLIQRSPDQAACIGWSLSEKGENIPVAHTHTQLINNAAWLKARQNRHGGFRDMLSLYPATNLTGLLAMVSWLNEAGTLNLTSHLGAAHLTTILEENLIETAWLPIGLAGPLSHLSASDTHFAFLDTSPANTKSAEAAENFKETSLLYNLAGLCLISAENMNARGQLRLGPQPGTEVDEQDAPALETRLQGARQKAGETSTSMKGRLEINGRIVACTGPLEGMTTAPLNTARPHWQKTQLEAVVVDETMTSINIVPGDKTICHGSAILFAEELDQLYQTYPGFLDAAAFTIRDPLMGERLFAAIIPRPGDALSYDDFRLHLLNQQISPAKIPEKLVTVPEIPRTSDGLIARSEILRAPAI